MLEITRTPSGTTLYRWLVPVGAEEGGSRGAKCQLMHRFSDLSAAAPGSRLRNWDSRESHAQVRCDNHSATGGGSNYSFATSDKS
jgi:hypothetical protein